MSNFSLSVFVALGALGILPMQHDQVAVAPPIANVLSVERVAAEPDRNPMAETMQWSPDGAKIAWLHRTFAPRMMRDNRAQREIWSVETALPESGKPAEGSQRQDTTKDATLLVSAARVTASLRGSAPVLHPNLEDDDDESNPYLLKGFFWSLDHRSLLVFGGQSIAWLDLASGAARMLVSGDDALTDVSMSPDQKNVAFVREHKLCIVPVTGGPVRTFAAPQQKDIFTGEPDWPYRNEWKMPRAYWWSPDSSQIAYLELDDRAVAKFPIRSSEGEINEIVYPKPGGDLPIAQLYVKPTHGGVARKIDLGITKNMYLPRVTWMPDSRQIAIERIDRYQHNLSLLLANAGTGRTKSILDESDKYWINVGDNLRFLGDSKRFLWLSERSGFRHLYLYDMQGKQLAQLTKGDWEVAKIDAVDEAEKLVYFTSTEKSVTERHLYSVSLEGGDRKRITQDAGDHEVAFDPQHARYVDQFSTFTVAPQFRIINAQGPAMGGGIAISTVREAAQTLQALPTAQIGPAGAMKQGGQLDLEPLAPGVLQEPEFVSVRLHVSGEVHGFVIRPPNFDPEKKYPVIVYLAGGPGEQIVRDQWHGATGLWMQWMASKGFIVFAMDNQGTAGRGHYFEEPIHLRLGAQELVDLRDGVDYLRTLPYVDITRLGVCGWGYGGFLSIHAILDRPVPFKAAFAGAPVLDWHFYDAIFPERYLEDTVKHADGWDASMAIENLSPRYMKGSLMLAIGTQDEFVHMDNILLLQDRLLDAGKSAETLLLADRGHQIEDLPARQVLFARMTEFFLKNL
jgi:dipeptidyl-peptidase-4